MRNMVRVLEAYKHRTMGWARESMVDKSLIHYVHFLDLMNEKLGRLWSEDTSGWHRSLVTSVSTDRLSSSVMVGTAAILLTGFLSYTTYYVKIRFRLLRWQLWCTRDVATILVDGNPFTLRWRKTVPWIINPVINPALKSAIDRLPGGGTWKHSKKPVQG